MNDVEKNLKESIIRSNSRFNLWTRFVQLSRIKIMAEIGVYKGEYALKLLEKCNSIEKYYMIDPWRHLDNWNKPANKDDDTFEKYLLETKLKTEFAAERRIILRGKTTEVIDEIQDGELDFTYIDGDHTLKGITIDLIRVYPKIRFGGYIGGDDFSRTIWQHSTEFEPTLVFPFAIYFAEAVGACIYGLPFGQYLIEKGNDKSFSFVDLTGKYKKIVLKDQFSPDNLLKLKMKEAFPLVANILSRVKKLIHK